LDLRGRKKQEDEEICMRIFIICTFHQIFIPVIISRRMIWAGHAARMGGIRNAFNILVRKRERKSSLGTRRHRREDNIEMDLKDTRWEGLDCIGSSGGPL
jgi:hypothetical protein